jgi:hypothetical protein
MITTPAVVACLIVTSIGLDAAPARSTDYGPDCLVHADVTLEPGLTLSQTSVAFHNPTPGPVTCTGPVDGYHPTGPGTYVETGHYTGSCLGGSGDGQFTIEIPTDGGKRALRRSYTFKFLDQPPRHGGMAGGSIGGQDLSGNFDVTPTTGDCVVTPLTRMQVVLEFQFSRDAEEP